MNVLFTLPFLFLTSCNDSSPYVTKMLNASSKLGNKYGLSCFGSGIYGPNKIEAYSLDFKTDKPCDINESRNLLINYVEDYIKIANTMQDVIKNIENPPFSEKHGALRIMVPEQDYMGKRFCGIELQKGRVAFIYRDKEKGLEDLFYESYSEAYFKVRGTYPPPRN